MAGLTQQETERLQTSHPALFPLRYLAQWGSHGAACAPEGEAESAGQVLSLPRVEKKQMTELD